MFTKLWPPPSSSHPPHTHIMGKIMGFQGLQDGCQWICSNSAKIWAGNYWYHTQCVSGRLDHKTDFFLNCWKKINYFPREGGGGGYPSMENSMEIIKFFLEAFPKMSRLLLKKRNFIDLEILLLDKISSEDFSLLKTSRCVSTSTFQIW